MTGPETTTYPRPAIGSVNVLARALGVPEKTLRKAALGSKAYRVAGRKEKKDGTHRTLWEAREPLKTIQARITSRILRVVEYPTYLQGALVGKDYVSNAKMHAGRKALVGLDIKAFYPNCQRRLIYSIWLHFFRFPPEVAALLSDLTTRDNALPQGASTSSYLANLVFFRNEPQLAKDLLRKGFTYSRFIDDISISAPFAIDSATKSALIKAVLGLVAPLGFRLHRGKLQISDRGKQMSIHKLNIKPRRPGLFRQRRNQIRATVKSVEIQASESREGPEYRKRFRKARGLAAMVKRFHKSQGQALLDRLSLITPRPSDADVANLRRKVKSFNATARKAPVGVQQKRLLNKLRQEIGELKRFRPSEAKQLKQQIVSL